MARRTFSMRALPPFRLDPTVLALRRRRGNAVDTWDGRTYRRALEVARSSRRDPDTAIPGLRAHLEGCPACREEHESLFALVSGEQAL
jgi:hypothetical protein